MGAYYIGVIKGDTRSLDYSSHEPLLLFARQISFPSRRLRASLSGYSTSLCFRQVYAHIYIYIYIDTHIYLHIYVCL